MHAFASLFLFVIFRLKLKIRTDLVELQVLV